MGARSPPYDQIVRKLSVGFFLRDIISIFTASCRDCPSNITTIRLRRRIKKEEKRRIRIKNGKQRFLFMQIVELRHDVDIVGGSGVYRVAFHGPSGASGNVG